MIQAHGVSRITRFLSAGGIGVLLYYLILYVFTELIGVWYMVSVVIASTVNWSFNFVFQKFRTFQNKDTKNIHRQAVEYTVMAIGLSIANSLLLYILVEYHKLWYFGAQVIVTIPLTIASYFITRQIFDRGGNHDQLCDSDLPVSRP